MESLHNSNEFVIVVLLALVALVGGDVFKVLVYHSRLLLVRQRTSSSSDDIVRALNLFYTKWAMRESRAHPVPDCSLLQW
jgi:hypothetical protein